LIKREVNKMKRILIISAVILLIGLLIIAIAEPVAFQKANAEYETGKWAWYNEYRSFIYETTSDNIKTIGLILSFIGTAGIMFITYKKYNTPGRLKIVGKREDMG